MLPRETLVNLRDLRYFIALAETRHFGQAATRTFVSQPTLSGQIRKLEAELGVALFERTTKAVALTPLGEALLPLARRTVEEADALAQQTMDICRMADRKDAGEQADLRATSLETLLQLVGAQMGATLVPALALRGAWTTDAGVIARPLKAPGAYRRISLVWRKSFPRKAAIEALAEVILSNLPNTVWVPGR